MAALRQQLREILHGRVCLVGVGNVELGDDGFGVRLVERLGKRGTRNAERGMPRAEHEPWRRGREPFPLPEGEDQRDGKAPAEQPMGNQWSLVIAGTTPERHMPQLAAGTFDTVLFLDAVEVGAAPGSVVLLNSSEMAARFPQISTHKISLGLLAQLIEAAGRTKAWLLGVQPESLRGSARLSSKLQASLDLLANLLAEVAPTSSRPYRQLPVGQPSEPPVLSGFEIRDPAEWNSALRPRVADGAGSAFRVPRSALPC